MKLKSAIIVSALGLMNLSFAPQRNFVPLTENYGIVTKADIEEELPYCGGSEPFDSKRRAPCLHHWQCLPTHHVFLDCEDIGFISDYEHTGQPIFWIQDGEITHHYVTRRNFDMEVCHQWVEEWKAVLAQEEIVCFSGDFVLADTKDEHPSSPPGTQYYWDIDRMKSRAGEWSYLFRGNANHKHF